MLVSIFSAKGAPGATSTALALTAVWPRPVLLVEADPSGSDLIYRCRSSAGGPVDRTPNILGLASAVRGGNPQLVSLSSYGQDLECGVRLLPGVSTPAQGRGMAGLWQAIAAAARASTDFDIIADLGRLQSGSAAFPMAAAADVRVPVVAASLESLMHMREALKEFSFDAAGRTAPVMVGLARTATQDREDLDEVLASAGVFAAPTLHMPLDHPGLEALESGMNPSGRGRGSQLVRGARDVAHGLLAVAGVGEYT